MDFNQMPRIIATHTHLNHNQGFFFLGFTSGTLNSAFLLEPAMAKALHDQLGKHIAEYEKTFGNIDISGTEAGIASPIQPG